MGHVKAFSLSETVPYSSQVRHWTLYVGSKQPLNGIACTFLHAYINWFEIETRNYVLSPYRILSYAFAARVLFVIIAQY